MRTKTARPIMAVLGALTVVAVLAACSGGGSGSGDAADDDVASLTDDDGNETAGASEDDGEAELLDWVECMRGEGIDLPDPTRDADGNLVLNGNGITVGGGESDGTFENDEDSSTDEEPPIDPQEMDAAQETCGMPPRVGGEDSEKHLQEQQDAALEFAQCMRDQGIEDFPDPDFSDMGPGSGPQTASESAGEGEGPVVAGPFGEIDLDDPETAAAFEACQDQVGEDFGPPGGGDPEPPADDREGTT